MAKALYFDNHLRRIVSTSAKNLSGRFKKLTAKQKKFRAENPEAGYSEIMNCALAVPVETSLEDFKSEGIALLSQMSIARGEKLVPAYKVRNLITGVYDETTDPKASELREEIRRIDSMLRNEFYRLKAGIEAAENKEMAEEVFDGNNFEGIE